MVTFSRNSLEYVYEKESKRIIGEIDHYFRREIKTNWK